MSKQVRFRIDFEMEVLSMDEATHQAQIVLRPRSDRYEWRTVDGKRMLYDKLDDLLFPESVVEEFAKGLHGVPVGFETSDQDVWNFEEYISTRVPEIEKRARGQVGSAYFADKSADFLESLFVNKLEFAILSIDIKDSSVLSNKLEAEVYQKLVDTFTFEVGGLVPKFHGHVLKYLGDGLIAYFPAPSFIVKNDLAMECALAMRKLVYLGLDPVFSKIGLPTIDIRIGLDSGEAYVRAIGNPAAKRHLDIIGEVVNLATKVQSISDVGGIALGDETYRSLHTSWRHLCAELKLPDNWKYKDSDGKPYKVFKVQFKPI